MAGLRTLLLDNHDSFTYNLFALLADVNGQEPIVVANDAATWDELETMQFDNIVISPGPGRPDRLRDFGVCAQAIRHARVPLLGVCLGHQGLCLAHGARLVAVPDVVHGRSTAVVHTDSPLFAGLPREFQAVRYHSLCVAQPLPAAMEPIATTSDGVLMAAAHRTLPHWGVQFHPESVCTEHGRRLIANFARLTEAAGARPRRTPGGAWRPRPNRPATRVAATRGRSGDARLSVTVRRLELLCDSERAFVDLYGDADTAFWLDSARIDAGARFSFMGDATGPLAEVIRYDVGRREVQIERGDSVEVRQESIFDHLSGRMREMRHSGHELPFDFNGGFVGYLGYECKADCGGSAAHSATLPDATFIFADRLIVFDHVEKSTYLVCVSEAAATAPAERWIGQMEARLASLQPPQRDDCPPVAAGLGQAALALGRPYERYLDDIAACKQRLRDGESYEVCLTNTITAAPVGRALDLYRRLRRVNPAPYSAYMRFGDCAVLSSSPERFLRVHRDRWVEAKPIKGTCARGATAAEDVRLAQALRTSEKNRAENLMIVDLIRNDLGRVCEVGTVHVPELMHVESFQTVHQLVSTVRGLLREDVLPPDCVRACFPAGSMTGAPKQRTMEIIDELEGSARGVYAGAIGYLGLGGGCDLSVVIRTIIVEGQTATVGTGGAIVIQSDPEEEYQEAVLKALAPVAAVEPGLDLHAALAGAAQARPKRTAFPHGSRTRNPDGSSSTGTPAASRRARTSATWPA